MFLLRKFKHTSVGLVASSTRLGASTQMVSLGCNVTIPYVVSKSFGFKSKIKPVSNRGVVAKDDLRIDPAWFRRVESLILFVGHGRSGHTLISALLDAHPHVMIAHEFHLLERWSLWPDSQKNRSFLFRTLYQEASDAVLKKKRESTKGKHSYIVPGEWSGKCDGYVTVIGDKRGGGTADFLSNTANFKFLESIYDAIKLPIKVVHVIRNPFDVVSTAVLHSLNLYFKAKSGELLPVNNAASFINLRKQVARFIIRTRAFASLVAKQYPFVEIHNVRSERLIQQPVDSLKRLCHFLDVSCSSEYLEHCTSILYSSPSTTKSLVTWPSYVTKQLQELISQHDFLKGYKL
eukprot:m.784 g.784  ORF g.784 m.784 type:complete len:348 (+) comp4861_c0_seq1:186-1229(+)